MERVLLLAIAVFGFTQASLDEGCEWVTVEGHSLKGNNNRVLTGLSLEECKKECEEERTFNCRSLDFGVVGHDCYLSEFDRYESEILEIRDYNYNEIVCKNDDRDLSKCPLVGPISDYVVPASNMKVLEGLSVKECEDMCRKETNFWCNSFEHTPSTGQCSLSNTNRGEIMMVEAEGVNYYEISCRKIGCQLGEWQGPVVGMAIPGNNLAVYSYVDLQECLTRAKNEVRFIPKSVEYNKQKQQCHVHAVNSEEVSLSVYGGWDYYELSGCEGGRVTIRSEVCTCMGDPHFRSFDGKQMDFMGTCQYIMSRDNCVNSLPNGDPSWEVIVDSDLVYPKLTVASARRVQVKLHDHRMNIGLVSGRRVTVNNKPMLGFPQKLNDDVTLTMTTTNIYVTVRNGPQIVWDGTSFVQVWIPSTLREKTCGLCGNANEIPGDDWTVGESDVCMEAFPDATPGTQATDVNLFGFSWTHKLEADDQSCLDSCSSPPLTPDCPEDLKMAAEEHCNVMRNINGPFKDCLAVMSSEQAEDHFRDCVYDSCQLNDQFTAVCEHSKLMARACMTQLGVTVFWRTDDFCPMECGEGMVYKACGRICLPTCGDPDSENCGDTDTCEEGCFCKEGKVYDGDNECFNRDQCGCKIPEQNDVYINAGESYMKDDCQVRCSCTEQHGDLVCEEAACNVNEECEVQEGRLDCQCNPPFIKVDDACQELISPCLEYANEVLSCYTCSSEGNEPCIGRLEMCDMENSICKVTLTNDKYGSVISTRKECASRTTCEHSALGEDGEHLEPNLDGEIITQCHYGKRNVDYRCTRQFKASDCELHADSGTGGMSVTRYFYDSAKGKCQEFTYQGADGNGNNFESSALCMAKCGKLKKKPPLCKEPSVVGQCDNFQLRYFFNPETHSCQKFMYSGCGGNSNRFSSAAECSNVCM